MSILQSFPESLLQKFIKHLAFERLSTLPRKFIPAKFNFDHGHPRKFPPAKVSTNRVVDPRPYTFLYICDKIVTHRSYPPQNNLLKQIIISYLLFRRITQVAPHHLKGDNLNMLYETSLNSSSPSTYVYFTTESTITSILAAYLK